MVRYNVNILCSVQGMRRAKVNPTGGSGSAVSNTSTSAAKQSSSASKLQKGEKPALSAKISKKDHLTSVRVRRQILLIYQFVQSMAYVA